MATSGNTLSSAKVIKKKEERITVLSDRPLGLASLSEASPPRPLPAASVGQLPNCRVAREEVVAGRPLISNTTITYARLSLLAPKSSEYTGMAYNRMAVNLDISYNSNPEFQRYKWRLTNKRSEYYSNLPDGWETDYAYGNAWDHFNELTTARWLGKACYRLHKGQRRQLAMVPFCAMVMWAEEEMMYYTFWIENAEISGRFNLPSASKYYLACSNPIHNMQPRGWKVIEL